MINEIDIKDIIDTAKLAGEDILKIYQQDFEVFDKEDASPLTLADKNANDLIINNLQKKYPNIPYISEEVKQTSFENRKDWEYFWMIDPLDGTKEFIKKNGEFTVNIALIHHNKPVLGVVYIPVQNTLYYAIKNKGTYKIDELGNSIQLTNKQTNNLTDLIVVASRSHLSKEVEDYVEALKNKGKNIHFLSAGSSLKFCLIAEGKANIYPRFAPTMEWDTAAAHILCTELGYDVIDYDTKNELIYNKKSLLNPWFIVS